jgi:methylated-DNA-[protein]-cysteine S-methyltransferase
MTHTCTIDTPLGLMLAAAKGGKLAVLNFLGQKHFAAGMNDWLKQPDDPVLVALRAWLQGYFSGAATVPDVPLDPGGTPFQKTVWSILLRIPRGATTSYGEIAREVAEKTGKAAMSAQAVGGAVGRNPIAILIPCHRVLGADGSLTGYAGGLDKKRALLALEGITVP